MFAKSLLKFLLSAILEHCHKYCSKDEFRLHEKFKGHIERYLGTSNTFSTEDRVSQLRLLSPEKKIAKSRGGGGGGGGGAGFGDAQVQTRITANVIQSFSLTLRRAQTSFLL